MLCTMIIKALVHVNSLLSFINFPKNKTFQICLKDQPVALPTKSMVKNFSSLPTQCTLKNGRKIRPSLLSRLFNVSNNGLMANPKTIHVIKVNHGDKSGFQRMMFCIFQTVAIQARQLDQQRELWNRHLVQPTLTTLSRPFSRKAKARVDLILNAQRLMA
jgi:hypothetical protein